METVALAGCGRCLAGQELASRLARIEKYTAGMCFWVCTLSVECQDSLQHVPQLATKLRNEVTFPCAFVGSEARYTLWTLPA